MKALKVKDLIKTLQDSDPEDFVAIGLDNRLDKILLVQDAGFIETQVYLQNIKGM